MFQPDPSLTHIAAGREQIVSIIESINHPHVGVPGYAAQVTSAFVVGRRNPDGTFSIFVYLHLTETNQAVIYVNDNPALDAESFRDVETEALTFVESMGFMVDNVNYRNLTPEQQQETLETLPCFAADLSAFAADAGGDPLDELMDDTGDVLDLGEDQVLEDLDEIEPEPPAPAVRPLDAAAAARIGKLLASF